LARVAAPNSTRHFNKLRNNGGGSGDALLHGRAHAAQQFAFSVFERFGHHRAVEVQIDAVDRHGDGEPADQFAADALERVRGYKPAGPATGPNQRHDLVTRIDRPEESRERETGVGEPADDSRPRAPAADDRGGR
jgi:hypothetical protein